MPHPAQPEPYLSAKQLAAEFQALNIRPCGYRAMLALIGECPASVGAQVRLVDAISFLRDNPTWQPRRMNHHASAQKRTGAQTPTIATL